MDDIETETEDYEEDTEETDGDSIYSDLIDASWSEVKDRESHLQEWNGKYRQLTALMENIEKAKQKGIFPDKESLFRSQFQLIKIDLGVYFKDFTFEQILLCIEEAGVPKENYYYSFC